MRHIRIAIILVLLAGGVLGGYWIAAGQEGRPWPPPPVKFEEGAERAPAAPPAPSRTPVSPAPGQNKTSKDKSATSVVRKKWTINVLPAETPKGEMPKARICGVGGDENGLQPVAFQENGPPPIPPPIPPMVTTMPAIEPKTVPPKVMPDVPPPLGAPVLPVGPTIIPAKPAEPAKSSGMPVADPPRTDPTKNPITDNPRSIGLTPISPPPISPPPIGPPPIGPPPETVKSSKPVETPKSSKPPAFVLFKPGMADPVVSRPSTPGEPQQPIQPTQQTVARTVSTTEVSPPILGLQTAPVIVEKRALPVRPGDAQSFQLTVRNQGAIAAAQVIVEDDLPAEARVTQAEPMPVIQASRAIWTLREMAPGTVRVLLITLQSAAAIEAHSTRVHVSAANSVGTPTQAPVPQVTVSSMTPAPAPSPTLGVNITAPAGAAVGQSVTFDVTYANTGKQRVTGLVLHALLSEGLRHPVGQSIEADVGNMEPGASKTVKVTVVAAQPGRQGIQVLIKNATGGEASAQAGLDVVAAPPAPSPTGGLSVLQAPSLRLFAERVTDLRIEVTNQSTKPMRHVSIVSALPEGLEFVAASDYGNFQPNQRTVNWLLDPLPPGKMQALLVRVRASGRGAAEHTVTARADGVPETRSTGTLSIEGIADLALSLGGDQAVEAGKETVFEIRVGNPGSGPNTNVRVEVAFTEGLTPRAAQGPGAFRIDGQNVIFEPLSTLVAQGQAVYRVQAVGQVPGDARVRATVVSDQVRAPAAREMGMRIYRD